jgi:hypothetical protein
MKKTCFSIDVTKAKGWSFWNVAQIKSSNLLNIFQCLQVVMKPHYKCTTFGKVLMYNEYENLCNKLASQ